MNLRDLLGVGTELKESIFKNRNQINSTVTTRTWVLPTEWTGTWPSAGLASEWKKHLPFPLVWMVDVVLQGVWVLYRINKDEVDESLPLLAFWRDVVNATFLKYSKEDRLSSSNIGIRNIPLDVCYDDTKHYQVQPEHRRIQNSFKHLRWRRPHMVRLYVMPRDTSAAGRPWDVLRTSV